MEKQTIETSGDLKRKSTAKLTADSSSTEGGATDDAKATSQVAGTAPTPEQIAARLSQSLSSRGRPTVTAPKEDQPATSTPKIQSNVIKPPKNVNKPKKTGSGQKPGEVGIADFGQLTGPHSPRITQISPSHRGFVAMAHHQATQGTGQQRGDGQSQKTAKTGQKQSTPSPRGGHPMSTGRGGGKTGTTSSGKESVLEPSRPQWPLQTVKEKESGFSGAKTPPEPTTKTIRLTPEQEQHWLKTGQLPREIIMPGSGSAQLKTPEPPKEKTKTSSAAAQFQVQTERLTLEECLHFKKTGELPKKISPIPKVKPNEPIQMISRMDTGEGNVTPTSTTSEGGEFDPVRMFNEGKARKERERKEALEEINQAAQQVEAQKRQTSSIEKTQKKTREDLKAKESAEAKRREAIRRNNKSPPKEQRKRSETPPRRERTPPRRERSTEKRRHSKEQHHHSSSRHSTHRSHSGYRSDSDRHYYRRPSPPTLRSSPPKRQGSPTHGSFKDSSSSRSSRRSSATRSYRTASRGHSESPPQERSARTAATILHEQRNLEEQGYGYGDPSAAAGFESSQQRGTVDDSNSGWDNTNTNFGNDGFGSSSGTKRPATGQQSGQPSFKKPNVPMTIRSPPVSNEFERFVPAPHVTSEAIYTLIDAGPQFAIGVIVTADIGKKAPPFVHIIQKDRVKLRIGYQARITKFHRKLDREGQPAPEQTIRASEDALCELRNTKKVLVPSFVVKEYTLIPITSDNIITGAPAILWNKPHTTQRPNDPHYRLAMDIVSGYFVGMRTVSNVHIDTFFTIENSPGEFGVVLTDIYQVTRGTHQKLGQCVVPKGIFIADALDNAPPGSIVERIFPLAVERERLLTRVGNLAHRFPNVNNYANNFEFIKGGLMMHIAAAIHIERTQARQSEIDVIIKEFEDDHRTVMDKTEDEPGRNADKKVIRARAMQLKNGNAVVLRDKIAQPPGQRNFKYSTGQPRYRGIIEQAVTNKGKVFSLTVFRPTSHPVITGELRNQEFRQDIATELARLIERSEVEPNTTEAKRKMREAMTEKRLAQVATASVQDEGEDRPTREASGFRGRAEERTDQEQREREDQPGISDMTYFVNHEIETDNNNKYALTADDLRIAEKPILDAYHRWQHNLEGKTATARLCCLLSGVVPPHEEDIYELHTEYRKILRAEIVRDTEGFMEAAQEDQLEEFMARIDLEDTVEADIRLGHRGHFGESLQEMENKVTNKNARRDQAVQTVALQQSLDDEQKQAVVYMLEKPLVKTQAPAGTGKTYLAGHAAIFAVKTYEERVLFLAETNQAIVHMVKQTKEVVRHFAGNALTEYSIFLIRSNAAEIRTPLKEEQGLGNCMLKNQLKRLTTFATTEDPNGWNNERLEVTRKYIDYLERDVYSAADLMTMNKFVLRYSQEVKTIAITKANAFALRYHLDTTTVIIDEAGQILADDVTVLLADTMAERLLVVGDIFQMGCYVPMGLTDKAFGLRQSSVIETLEGRMRTCKDIHKAEVTLTISYRFQSDLLKYVSYGCYEEFGSALQPPEGNRRFAKEQIAISGYPFPKKGVPIILLHTEASDTAPDTGSCYNDVQRNIARRIYDHMRTFFSNTETCKDKTFLFNAFYKDEANLLKEQIRDENLPNVESFTISSFQGQERHVQIIITSKNKIKIADKNTQFILDPRLDTTALTRGAECMVIVGNFDTLCELRCGPFARFVFECVRDAIPIVDARWLEDIELTNPNTLPQNRYDEDAILVGDDGSSLCAEVWANDPQLHREQPLPPETYKWLRAPAPSSARPSRSVTPTPTPQTQSTTPAPTSTSSDADVEMTEQQATDAAGSSSAANAANEPDVRDILLADGSKRTVLIAKDSEGQPTMFEDFQEDFIIQDQPMEEDDESQADKPPTQQ